MAYVGRTLSLSPWGIEQLAFVYSGLPMAFSLSVFFFFFLFAALGLCCCAQASSSCSDQGLLFVVVCGVLIVVVSLVAEHGL